MLFNSFRFLFVFLPVVLLVYWLTPSLKARKYISVVSSYVFYGVWSYKFALLMLATTSVDFFTARLLNDTQSPRMRRLWLTLSMVSNLGVLGIFKYYDFFASSLNALAPHALLPLIHVALPIGISFYTFESMSYTIDVYKGKVPAIRHFIDYAHFVTMFPRLVAGPIARYSDMTAQFHALPRWLPAADVAEAIHFFTVGLAKKVLLADYLATKLVNPLWANPHGLKFTTGWAAALSYTAQLYFDFSGYSDMAVGLALLLGFRLPRNFNLPYTSRSISEFWRRWHISLGSWLRDYLYIPLGGNRKGPWRKSLNLFLTMALGGLWHGANWTFVIWGCYHGIAQVIENTLEGRMKPLPKWLAVGGTFLAVVVGWVLFRANSLGDALLVLRAMIGLNGIGLAWVRANLFRLVILAGALVVSITVDTYELKPALKLRWALAYGLILTACITMFSAPSPFLYFQF
ncbi:MAG: MBOAT family O-acyltransferase [Mycobacterium leprae]